MKHSTPLFVVAVLAISYSGSSAMAQQSNPNDPDTLIEIEQTVGRTYKKLLGGDFDDDGQEDLAYQLGGDIGVCLAPGLYEAALKNITVANDFAVFPDADGDRILTVGSSGLHELAWNESPSPPYFDSISMFPPPPIVPNFDQADWLGAECVDTWTNENKVWAFGITSDKRGVVGAFRLAGQPGWTETDLPVLATGSFEDLRQIVALDFDADGKPEAAVLSDSAVAVYDLVAGVEDPIRLEFKTNARNDAMCRVQDTQTTLERLAVVSTLYANPNNQAFRLIGPAGAVDQTQLFSGLAVYSIVSGLRTDDDVPDLALASPNGAVLRWIDGVDAGQAYATFDLQAIAGTSWEYDGVPNASSPVILDIEHDGDGDICVPMQDSGRLAVRRSASVDHKALQPRIISFPDPFSIPEYCREGGFWGKNSTDLTLDDPRLFFDVDVTNAPSQATHLDVILWKKAPAGSLDPRPFAKFQLDLAPGPAIPPNPPTPPTQFSCEAPIPDVSASDYFAPFDCIVFVALQYVVLSNDIECLPGRLYGVAGDGSYSDSEDYVHTLSMWSHDQPLAIYAGAPNEANPPTPGDGRAGGGGDVPCLPSDGEPPEREP